MYKRMLHGYRQFMLRNVWLISLMDVTLFFINKKLCQKVFKIKMLVISYILKDNC